MNDQPGPGSLRRRLRTPGASLLGTFVQAPHPSVCELVAQLGFDFLCVEAEHSNMNPETVQALVAAAELGGTRGLVRVAGNEPVQIASALDAGAAGVIVPRVESAAEASAAVAASRFPPLGERGAGPGRAAGYGASLPLYMSRANEDILVAVQVETRRAVESLDEILSVEGVDLIFVGPGDLTSSLGLAGIDDPALIVVMDEVIERTRAAGRWVGTFAPRSDQAVRWLARGVQLMILGSDVGFLMQGARSEQAALAERTAAVDG